VIKVPKAASAVMHTSKIAVNLKISKYKGYFLNCNESSFGMPTYCFFDRFFEAFKGVEHAAPNNWRNLTGGPTMSLMTVNLRMPNCRYRHACICFTNLCKLFLVTQAAPMAGYVKALLFLSISST